MKKLQRCVEKFNGLSVGLDLHKQFIQVSVLDRHGDEIQAERIRSDQGLLTAWVDHLLTRPEAERDLRVAMEASGCFVWVYDLLKAKLGKQSVRVAAPSKVKVIAHRRERCVVAGVPVAGGSLA